MIHNSHKVEATKCLLVDEWISKMWYVKKGALLALGRKEILVRAVTQLNLEDIMPHKTSQVQKDKYYPIPFIYGI
jgi:hypothetical protein